MRCPYCAARVERQAWFCPECKRSTREVGRSTTRTGPARGAARGAVALAAAGIAVAVTGFIVARITLQTPARVDAPEPFVRITPVAEPDAPRHVAALKVPAKLDGPEPAEIATALPAPQETVATSPPAQSPPIVLENGAVTVMTTPPERTFVYLDGGTLLGETPLRNASVPAGRHRLVFWTPSVQGRSVRTVHVEPGASVLVVEKVRAQQQFSDAGT